MLLCVERVERNTRERERACIKLFSIVSFLFVEIKQCVLSPSSVSKPPPVVSPTNSEESITTTTVTGAGSSSSGKGTI